MKNQVSIRSSAAENLSYKASEDSVIRKFRITAAVGAWDAEESVTRLSTR